MIIKPELVKRIKEYFNLNIYETKVWLALLSKGIASAGEVAELSGVPRSRTYDVLESLEKRGFAITKIGKPVKYISVKPTEVVEKIKSRAMAEAQEKVNSLSALKETQEYTELEQLHNSGISPIKSSEIAGSMRGRANVLSRIRDLLENAKKEAVICTSATDFEDKGRVISSALDKLNKKDIKIRVALSGEPEKIKRINSRFNIKAIQINSNARIFMIDKKEILFMVTPENAEEEIGVWLDSPFFTDSLSTIIDGSLRAEKLQQN
ncbi:TrmB family transcriptional regulator [Candidatus Pacearchaeota archaeon]|nr:TrmB family transcriptional regulator [Candidatus Pacearchaeota archaeon]